MLQILSWLVGVCKKPFWRVQFIGMYYIGSDTVGENLKDICLAP